MIDPKALPPTVYSEEEGGLLREFLGFADFVTDNPPMQKREVSVRMIVAAAQALAPIIDRLVSEAREAEREAIVAWLRLMSDCFNGKDCGHCPGCGRKFAAQSIAAGRIGARP